MRTYAEEGREGGGGGKTGKIGREGGERAGRGRGEGIEGIAGGESSSHDRLGPADPGCGDTGKLLKLQMPQRRLSKVWGGLEYHQHEQPAAGRQRDPAEHTDRPPAAELPHHPVDLRGRGRAGGGGM